MLNTIIWPLLCFIYMCVRPGLCDLYILFILDCPMAHMYNDRSDLVTVHSPFAVFATPIVCLCDCHLAEYGDGSGYSLMEIGLEKMGENSVRYL